MDDVDENVQGVKMNTVAQPKKQEKRQSIIKSVVHDIFSKRDSELEQVQEESLDFNMIVQSYQNQIIEEEVEQEDEELAQQY